MQLAAIHCRNAVQEQVRCPQWQLLITCGTSDTGPDPEGHGLPNLL